MTFKSKRDRTFMILIMMASALIAMATLLPVVIELFFMEAPDMKAVWITLVLFLLCEGFILWVSLDIEYTFKEDYLFVRGGLFRSKIPFEDITKVNPTSNILVGYRILSSTDALEIHYKKAFMGSVIISPENREEFLKVLLEKAPHIHFVK
ncbi:PH domain-containing protein [Psychrobacillus sp. L3]|uniref:PH domain-containing protein n=1 Tax=Psychrobacillus sp. L3 TaxID=3236891 RepID=UPI0036F1E4AC